MLYYLAMLFYAISHTHSIPNHPLTLLPTFNSEDEWVVFGGGCEVVGPVVCLGPLCPACTLLEDGGQAGVHAVVQCRVEGVNGETPLGQCDSVPFTHLHAIPVCC